MKLKAGNVKKYGIPYQGSKTKVIPIIARFFPNADHFYDLFGGGFSVSHYMLENRSKSFKRLHYNEIRSGLVELIQDSINGKYNYSVFKPEWISRERFLREKESNAYIKIIWSFGNNGKDYLFGKDIEDKKRSMHQAVVFDEFDEFMRNEFGMSEWPNSLDITGKRLYLILKIRKEKRVELQRLQRLERLEQLPKIGFTSLDYRQIEIQSNSVIYCDIPYKNTASYGSEFDHKEFFDWSAEQTNPLFISEYKIDDKRFHLLKEISHRSTFPGGGLKSVPVTERLYGNKLANEIITEARRGQT